MGGFKEGTVLMATRDCDLGIADARQWIRDRGFTADDVRLIKADGLAQVISKREVWVGKVGS